MAKEVVITANVSRDLQKKLKGRVRAALKAAMEDTLFKQKEVVPVAYAEGATEYGWPLSFQAETVTPEGAIPGGTLKRSLTAELDDRGDVASAVFRSQVPYGFWVHEGTTRFTGRPYLTRPIKEVGIPVLAKELKAEMKKKFE